MNERTIGFRITSDNEPDPMLKSMTEEEKMAQQPCPELPLPRTKARNSPTPPYPAAYPLLPRPHPPPAPPPPPTYN